MFHDSKNNVLQKLSKDISIIPQLVESILVKEQVDSSATQTRITSENVTHMSL